MRSYLLKSPPTAAATYRSRYSSTLLQLLILYFYYLPALGSPESSRGYRNWPERVGYPNVQVAVPVQVGCVDREGPIATPKRSGIT